MSKQIVAAFLAVFCVLGVMYSNCSRDVTTLGLSSKSGGSSIQQELPFGHPDTSLESKGALVMGQLTLGDGDYVKSVLRDIFENQAPTQPIKDYVESVIWDEFTRNQSAFGRSCDPLSDGSYWPCYFMETNVNITMSSQSSSVRQGSVIQACRRILANDTVLSAVLGTISGGRSTPSSDSIKSAAGLFFPAAIHDPQLLGHLEDIDQTMAENSEKVMDRWRILLLTLCESPAWQIL